MIKDSEMVNGEKPNMVVTPGYSLTCCICDRLCNLYDCLRLKSDGMIERVKAVLPQSYVCDEDFDMAGLCEGCECQLVTLEHAKRIQQYFALEFYKRKQRILDSVTSQPHTITTEQRSETNGLKTKASGFLRDLGLVSKPKVNSNCGTVTRGHTESKLSQQGSADSPENMNNLPATSAPYDTTSTTPVTQPQRFTMLPSGLPVSATVTYIEKKDSGGEQMKDLHPPHPVAHLTHPESFDDRIRSAMLVNNLQAPGAHNSAESAGLGATIRKSPYSIMFRREWQTSQSNYVTQYPSSTNANIGNGFEKGMVFLDFQEFLQRKNTYTEREGVRLSTVVGHKLKIESDLYDKDLRPYNRVTYGCVFGRKRKSRGKGVRVSKTIKSDCPFLLVLKIDKKKKVYVVRESIMDHNHICDSESLPQLGRRLPTEMLEPRKKRKRLKEVEDDCSPPQQENGTLGSSSKQEVEAPCSSPQHGDEALRSSPKQEVEAPCSSPQHRDEALCSSPKQDNNTSAALTLESYGGAPLSECFEMTGTGAKT